MQCILSALKSESKTFIDYYNLERDNKFHFPVFRKKDLYLIGIGVGKKYIESRVNGFIQKMENSPIQFINVGLAGGKKNIHTIGDIFIINKIKDENSKNLYRNEKPKKWTVEQICVKNVKHKKKYKVKQYDKRW